MVVSSRCSQAKAASLSLQFIIAPIGHLATCVISSIMVFNPYLAAAYADDFDQ